MNDIIKRVIGFDAYGYISKAIKNGDIQNIDVWLNSPSPTGYKGTQDLQEAAKRVDESLLDLAFATQNKEIIQRILKSECANLHSVNKKDSHNALANILLQEKQEDREEFFQIIKDKLNERDYINLLAANKVTDLLPRLFKLAGGIDPKIAQAMFEKAVRDGYQKSALLLFNQFPEIDLSFKTDIKMRATSLYDDNIDEKNISPLKNLIYKIQNYSIFHKDDNDDQAEIRSLLLTLLKNGDLNKLENNLLYNLFAGSETSSDLELIESLLNNKTYTLAQYDVKEALETIAAFNEIPDTATILIRDVLQRWNKDNFDDLRSISKPLMTILSKMQEDKMREILSIVLKKDLTTQFISIKDYHSLFIKFIEQHGNKKSLIQAPLKYAKTIMAHCFWRQNLNSEEHNEDKFDKKQINLLWQKFQSTEDKEILKAALKAEVINLDDISMQDKGLINSFTAPLLKIFNLKGSLNQDAALFKALAKFQDINLIKRLIRTKGFKISDENQFAGELLQTTDEIFHASITELHKKNMLSEKLITALVQKISLQSTPAYKKHEILFHVESKLTIKALQKKTKQFTSNLLELYKNGCSIEYIQMIANLNTDIKPVDNNDNTLLHATAACGIIEDVRDALQCTAKQINTKNNQGFTPLMLLCGSNTENKLEIAKCIINHADFNWARELHQTQINHLLLAYLADKDGFISSGIAEYLLSIPEVATEKNIRDLLLVALTDDKVSLIFPNDATIDAISNKVRNSKNFLKDAIASNNRDMRRQEIVHRIIKETTIDKQELYDVMFDTYTIYMRHKLNNNTNSSSDKISHLVQIAQKPEIDVNIQREERIIAPGKEKSRSYAHTSILGMACAHGASDVVMELIKLKNINLNCGITTSGDQISEIPPIMMAYNALRNNQEDTTKGATDAKKDIKDLNKPYIDIIQVLLEKDGVDLSKEFSHHDVGNISIAEILYNDPILSQHESIGSIRKNIINNICKSKDPSHIKDRLLMLACAAGDNTSVQTLLDNNASPLTKNEYGCHSLAIAAMNFAKDPKQYIKVIEQLTRKVRIEEYKINEKDKTGASTAHYIAAHCDSQTVKQILEGINDFQDDSKLLMSAYSGGNADVIEYVSGITQISDEMLKTLTNYDGNTALHYSAASMKPGIDNTLKILIEKGLDVNASNKHGITPLMLAIASQDLSKIDALLARKELDLNACEKNGSTPLMIACALGNREVIRRILNDPRVNVNQTNSSGMSALMITAYKDWTQQFSSIKDATTALENPAEKLIWRCDKQIATELIRRGADPLFGKNSEAFTTKMLLIMMKTSLLTLANHFLLMFNPILQRIGSAGIAWNTATEVGNTFGDLITKTIAKYVTDNKIDLNGFPIIGNYHIDKFGRVIAGDALKNAINKAPQYENGKQSIATASDLENAFKNANINNAAKWQIHNDLLYKYQHIQNVLQNSNLLPWTRRGLERVADEIVRADRSLTFNVTTETLGKMQVKDFRDNFKDVCKSINDQNRYITIDLMLKDDAIDLTKGTKEGFKSLLQKIAGGEIITDAKIMHNAKAFLDEYKKEIDYKTHISLFAAFKLQIKDLLKKIIPGIKPSKQLLQNAIASTEERRRILEKFEENRNNTIQIAQTEEPNMKSLQAHDKEEGTFSKIVSYFNYFCGSNTEKEEVAEKIAYSAGMLANIGARLATFTTMEKDLTLSVASPLLYYGTTSTALSLAGVGGGIAAAYGLYKGAKWLTDSSIPEQQQNIDVADDCSTKANATFQVNQSITKQYATRKFRMYKLGATFDDENVSESDLYYLDMLSGNTQEQMTSMAFKDKLLAEQQGFIQQSI
ncbi:ankyrin repeat domain-containing protein [Candidatus Lariskella endosymbiont of Epinotia ramella]|uniref:ankyrin repeat domain-containing protein n=1 Tax=Candidatus Lariskella endosymbiont of Epinotia ramella TaxID=3066224 RepID=UPI0030CBD242